MNQALMLIALGKIEAARIASPFAATRLLEEALALLGLAVLLNASVVSSAEFDRVAYAVADLKAVAGSTAPIAHANQAKAVRAFLQLSALTPPPHTGETGDGRIRRGLSLAMASANADDWTSVTTLSVVSAETASLGRRSGSRAAVRRAHAANRWLDRVTHNQATWVKPEAYSLARARAALRSGLATLAAGSSRIPAPTPRTPVTSASTQPTQRKLLLALMVLIALATAAGITVAI